MQITTARSRSVLTGLRVREAMRKQIVSLPLTASIDGAIRRIIKYKADALLVTGEGEAEPSVLSKTDLMGAYYAGLDIKTPLSDMVSGTGLIACTGDDTLDFALDTMKQHGVHRLYVTDPASESVEGVIAYTDVVGLLYRYCRRCEKSRFSREKSFRAPGGSDHIRVSEVMTPEVLSIDKGDSLYTAMELLSEQGIGAVLVRGDGERGVGVVSKTDLILAFRHGVSPETLSETVMTAPLLACPGEGFLHDAIREMIFRDVHRLFVGEGGIVSGVLTLTDAARARSGSCHACTVSRIIV